MKHTLEIETGGVSLEKASKALIMIHGRGGSARDIMSLSQYLQVDDFALLAPQAANNTWYPHSFMAPVDQNEPWLSSAIEIIGEAVQKAMDAGISSDSIYFFGFSQGACLSLEYIARNAKKYGGVAAIIGGVIGEKINYDNYGGDFNHTPIFLGTSNPDFHVPLERVRATSDLLKKMNGNVILEVYENAGHTILQEEINWVNKIFLDKTSL